MASWSDKIPQFNPYVQQLPIEAMTQVGMEKQRRYDEGVQRIQTQIDSVAGLPVMRDVDKKYLQSKLDSLNSSLRGVAAGDFSNYQLTNSVGGLVSQISKDRNIQNAVYSAQRVRKGQEEMEAARKEGKSSIQNEDFWDTQVNNWLNSTDVASTFNGRYVPYTDLSEKYAKVAKDVEAVEYSYDMPYVTGPDGKPLYFDEKGNVTTPDKGRLRIDDAMKSITRKGKSAQTILNNFYDSTTENDRMQLAIDAAYHYKHADVNTFKSDIVANFALKKKQLVDHTTELNLALKNPKISDAEKAKLQAELTDINSQLDSGEIEKQIAGTLEELKDPRRLDAFKIKLYTQKYLSNLAQDKATESYKEEIKNNPYAQMDMEKKKFQFDIQKENTRINQWNAMYALDVQKFMADQSYKEKSLKIKEAKEAAKNGSEPAVVSEGIRTDVVLPTATDLNNEINENNNRLAQINSKFLKQFPNYRKEDLDKFMDTFNKNPDSLDIKDNDLREYLNDRRNIENENIRKGRLILETKKLTSHLDNQLKDAMSSIPNIVDTASGNTYNSEEITNFIAEQNNAIKNSYTSVSGTTTAVKQTDYDTLLQKYRGTKYERLVVASRNVWLGKATATEKKLVDKIDEINNKINPIVRDIYQKKAQIEREYIKTKLPETISMSGDLDMNNKHDEAQVKAIIDRAMNPPIGVDSDTYADFDPELVNKWRNDTKVKDLGYRLIKNYDGSGKLVIQNGPEKQIVPLTASEMRSYFPRYSQVDPITHIKTQVLASPEFTTNPVGKNNPVTAAYTGDSLPLLRGTNVASSVRYDIEGSSSNIGDRNDRYQVRLYVFDGKIWHNQIVNQQGYVTEDKLQDVFNMIGTEIVASTLKQ